MKKPNQMSGFLDIIKEAKAQGPIDQNHKCQFCGKGFVRESTLTAHLCEENLRKDRPKRKIMMTL